MVLKALNYFNKITKPLTPTELWCITLQIQGIVNCFQTLDVTRDKLLKLLFQKRWSFHIQSQLRTSMAVFLHCKTKNSFYRWGWACLDFAIYLGSCTLNLQTSDLFSEVFVVLNFVNVTITHFEHIEWNTWTQEMIAQPKSLRSLLQDSGTKRSTLAVLWALRRMLLIKTEKCYVVLISCNFFA